MRNPRFYILGICLCLLLALCGCRVKTGIEANISAAEFVVLQVFADETVYETTVIDPEDVEALKSACSVLGEYEDGGYYHGYCALVFAGSESEIILYPAMEAADYILTGGGTYYRTGMDRREDLTEILASYGIILS